MPARRVRTISCSNSEEIHYLVLVPNVNSQQLSTKEHSLRNKIGLTKSKYKSKRMIIILEIFSKNNQPITKLLLIFQLLLFLAILRRGRKLWWKENAIKKRVFRKS